MPDDLSGVQKSFLHMLDFAERLGVGGTAVKLYNDVIQRGRTEPITEKDLTAQERSQFFNLVKAHSDKAGKTSGKIDYPDYLKHAPSLDSNILGGFRYSINDKGGVNIKDTYDFNADRAGPPIEKNPFVQALAVLANPRGLAAQIGRQVVPDTSGKGVPVNINLSPQGKTAMADDERDYTDRYNTPLQPQQEQQFQSWMKTQSASTGRDISKDLYDYDMRGDWLQGANRDERGHGTDIFKKPNHPTFSTGSKYHGVEGNEGGQWATKPDGSWSFAPGKTNLQNFSADEMQDYFKRVEPGNQLILPNPTQ